MKKHYPAIILLISSYKFYSIVRSYTNLLLSNQNVPEFVYYLIPRFYNFIILISFITLLIAGKTIISQKKDNTIFLNISKFASFKRYFLHIFIQNFKIQVYLLLPSLMLPLFALFFIRLDFNIFLTSSIALILIFVLESLLFSVFSIFYLAKPISLVSFLLLYNIYFAHFFEDYFYGIINTTIIIFIIFLSIMVILSSKLFIKWCIYENN